MRRLTMVVVMAISFISLTGFSYNKDKGRVNSPDSLSYNPLCINTMEVVMNETGYPSNIRPSRLVDLLLLSKEERSNMWTPMEALDKVMGLYASNFDQVALDKDIDQYYYKLKDADYYLVYEGIVEENYYLYHLYEFVLDDPDTGIGHTVTYGWYWVDQRNGEIIEQR